MPRRRAISLAVLAVVALTGPWSALAAGSQTLTTITVDANHGSAPGVSIDGVVEAVRQTTLAAQVAGAVIALPVKAGDSVRAGQELMRLDARAAQQAAAANAAQAQAAQAALNVANKEFDRQQQLRQKQYISQAALERAQAQRDAAQAQVQALQAQTNAAQAQSGFFVLHAPYNGVVSEVSTTLGDMALPGKPLLTVYDPSAMRVTAAVPQSLMAAVNAHPREIRYQLPGVSGYDKPNTPAQVQLLPAVDANTHTAQLRLSLPADAAGLTPGVFARISIPSGSASGVDAHLTVPASAVLQRGEVTAVYVIDGDGKPWLRQIRVGSTQGDRVEVLSGLRRGDKIAADARAAAAQR